MAIFLEEFLYRGRPPDATEPPAYHVVLGDVVRDAFGRTLLTTSGALTPDQAAAAGFPLPAVIAAIDAGLMAENAALRGELDALRREIAQPGSPVGPDDPPPA